AKSVLPWRKIGVEGLPAVLDVPPVAIEAFELVAKSDLLRRHEAQCGVIDLQIADAWRQPYSSIRVCRRAVCLAVGDDFLDLHRRRQGVEWKMTRIDDADANGRREPQSSIREAGHRRVETDWRRGAPDAVRSIEHGDFDGTSGIGDPRRQLCRAQ